MKHLRDPLHEQVCQAVQVQIAPRPDVDANRGGLRNKPGGVGGRSLGGSGAGSVAVTRS